MSYNDKKEKANILKKHWRWIVISGFFLMTVSGLVYMNSEIEKHGGMSPITSKSAGGNLSPTTESLTQGTNVCTVGYDCPKIEPKMILRDALSNSTTEISSNEFNKENTEFLNNMTCSEVNEFAKDVLGRGLNGDTIHDDIVIRTGQLTSACSFGIILPNANVDKLNSIIPTCSSIYQTSDDKWHYRNTNGIDLTQEQLIEKGNCN